MSFLCLCVCITFVVPVSILFRYGKPESLHVLSSLARNKEIQIRVALAHLSKKKEKVKRLIISLLSIKKKLITYNVCMHVLVTCSSVTSMASSSFICGSFLLGVMLLKFFNL